MRDGWQCTLLAALATVCASAGAQELRTSTVDQRHFSYMMDPDHFFVRPGNDGQVIFMNAAPYIHPGNLLPWQDEYCDARELVLDSAEYDLRAGSDETSETELYWNRLREYMGGASMEGLLPCWVVTKDFVNAAREKPELVDRFTSEALRLRLDGYAVPLVVFDVVFWDAQVEDISRLMQSQLPGWPLAVRVRKSNIADVPAGRWGCIIADEEVVPEHFRGQVAVQWLQSRYGQVPVFLSPARPDFLRDTAWMANGASGIWYRPLPEGKSDEQPRDWIHLRASAVFMSRFGQGAVKLSLRPANWDFTGNLEAADSSWAGILKAGTSETVVAVPEWMVGRVVGGAWFNPATDENIIEPLTTASESMTLRPPSDALWIYSRLVATQMPDTDTTVTAIKAWED